MTFVALGLYGVVFWVIPVLQVPVVGWPGSQSLPSLLLQIPAVCFAACTGLGPSPTCQTYQPPPFVALAALNSQLHI